MRPFLVEMAQDNAISMPLPIKYFSNEYINVSGLCKGLYLVFSVFLSNGMNVHYFLIKVVNFGQNRIIFQRLMSRKLTMASARL